MSWAFAGFMFLVGTCGEVAVVCLPGPTPWWAVGVGMALLAIVSLAMGRIAHRQGL